jgi:hypothetical protein
MKKLTAWIKHEADEGSLFVWIFLAFAVVIIIATVVFGAVHGAASL